MKQTNLTRNTAYMTIASIVQKVISFVYFMIVARGLGAEGTGKYFFALSFTTIFVIFVDLGFTNVMVREGAKLKEKLSQYVSSILYIKIFFALFTYIAAVVTINLMGYEIETKYLVYVSGITMLFDSLHLSLYGVLRAIGNLKFEAIGMILSQAITLILGSIFLWYGYPLIFLMIAFLIPSVLNALFALIIVVKKYHINLRPRYDRKILTYLIPIVIPFALAGIFGRVYSYIDSVLLSKLAGDIAVGWYSIPYKIAYAFQFIPLALVAALYPRFSEYFVHDKKKLQTVFHYGLKYLLIISLPIAVGIGLLSEDIVVLLFTEEYSNSIVPLQILIGGIVFSFINFVLGALLNACNKQTIQTTFIGIVMVINIILNVWLIPIFGVVGAAISAVVGNMLLTIFSAFIIPRIVKVSGIFLIKTIFQILIAVGVMGLCVWYTKDIGLVWAIVIGAVVYTGMLFMTGAVNRQQILELTQMWKK